MIGYIMLGCNDFGRAHHFYEAVMEVLGAVSSPLSSEKTAAYAIGPDSPMFAIAEPYDRKAASVGNGSMIAFEAPSRAIVDAVHVKAIGLGGMDEGAPGIRGDDPNGFYGAYFRDLDGHKLCVYRNGPP